MRSHRRGFIPDNHRRDHDVENGGGGDSQRVDKHELRPRGARRDRGDGVGFLRRGPGGARGPGGGDGRGARAEHRGDPRPSSDRASSRACSSSSMPSATTIVLSVRASARMLSTIAGRSGSSRLFTNERSILSASTGSLCRSSGSRLAAASELAVSTSRARVCTIARSGVARTSAWARRLRGSRPSSPPSSSVSRAFASPMSGSSGARSPRSAAW